MAEEDQSSTEDRTEDPTPDRREEFREQGQIAVSDELTSVAVLVAATVAIGTWLPSLLNQLQRILVRDFQLIATFRINQDNVLSTLAGLWDEGLKIILPLFAVTLVTSSASTLAQTRFNWSWERLSPDLSRLSIIEGIKRMFAPMIWIKMTKEVAKLAAVLAISYIVLKGEWKRLPMLMNQSMTVTWGYWGTIVKHLIWSVAALLLVIALADYFLAYTRTERQMRMTKQEIRTEVRQREGDYRLKAKRKSLARSIAMRKTLDKTKLATAIITNPTHYAIALRYEPGDQAPLLLAKGVDHLAFAMREVARTAKIPIIENPPLARELYATVKEGEEVPHKFYAAVAEIIRYVFKLKGRRLPAKRRMSPPKPRAQPSVPTTNPTPIS